MLFLLMEKRKVAVIFHSSRAIFGLKSNRENGFPTFQKGNFPIPEGRGPKTHNNRQRGFLTPSNTTMSYPVYSGRSRLYYSTSIAINMNDDCVSPLKIAIMFSLYLAPR